MEDFKTNKYEEYINLYEILFTLKREKKLFVFIFLFISTFGFIKAYRSMPIWKAEFQIVLTKKSSEKFSPTEQLQGLINQTNFSKSPDLETELRILESPVILMPAFNRYKNVYYPEDNDLKFKDWSSNISIELEPGTSVLKVSFINEEKNKLIPALNQISKEYQNYSKRDQKRTFKNTLDYLNNQINIYQEKSRLSLRKAQSFAIDNDLTPLTGKSDIDKEIKSINYQGTYNFDPSQLNSGSNTFNIELERLRYSNAIKIYKTKLKQLKNINDQNTLFLLGKTEEFMGKREITSMIENQNIKIETLKSLFTDNEPQLIKAIQIKKTYLNTFKNELYGFLNAKLLDAEARLKASERPEGVLVTYRELLRESRRDEEFLKKLELDRQILNLEQSMIIDPWELISKPTILDNPISKSKTTIFLIWIAISSILATAATVLKEYKSDLIFNKEEIINFINLKLLAILKIEDDEKVWIREIMLPLNEYEIEKFNKENINLIYLGNIKNKNKNKINSFFKDNFKKITDCEIDNVEKNGLNFLLIEKGRIKKNDLTKFSQKIKIYNLDINYWILID